MSQQPIDEVLARRYKIIKLVGRGAFGVTFLAEDMQRPSNPQCIVKQFQPINNDISTVDIYKFTVVVELLKSTRNYITAVFIRQFT